MRSDSELTGQEIVEISTQLASLCVAGEVQPQLVIGQVGLNAATIAINAHPPNVLWNKIVNQVHAGASENLGGGRKAVGGLVNAISSHLPGNAELNQLAFDLGLGPSPKSGNPKQNAPQQPPSSIFLSYASSDKDDVDQLYDAIKAKTPSLSVFQDWRSNPAGQQWLDFVEVKASNADTLVCWLTRNFLKRTFCHFEIGIARSCGVRIVPISAEPDIITKCPAYLSQFQAINAEAPFDFNDLASKLN